MEYQKAALSEIMGLPPDRKHSDSSGLADCLFAWLSAEAVPGPELVEGFVGRLDALKGAKGAPPTFAAGKELPACGKPLRGGPRHILADFLIGAHAEIIGATLLTLERGGGIYTTYFPNLKVWVPQ